MLGVEVLDNFQSKIVAWEERGGRRATGQFMLREKWVDEVACYSLISANFFSVIIFNVIRSADVFYPECCCTRASHNMRLVCYSNADAISNLAFV